MRQPHTLTQEQFDYIVAECDAVLAGHRDDVSVMAIAWLHVLHSHPTVLSRYVPVFHQKNSIVSAIGMLKDVLRPMADILLSIGSYFRTKNEWERIDPSTQVLIFSHLVQADAKRQSPDFYFQSLPEYLNSRGYTTAVALMNHVPLFTGWDPTGAQPAKFILPFRLDFVAECRIAAACFRNARKFYRQGRRERDGLRRSFLRTLSSAVLSPHTFRALRMHEMTRRMLRRASVQTVAFTWEGHSWERMVCHAAHEASSSIQAIGYQHTILFPSSHALMKSFGPVYDPDVVLTVGEVTRELLVASPEWKDRRIEVYGSPRLHEAPVYQPVGELRDACLVTPEGLESECIALFVFAKRAAEQMPHVQFIFRTHPVIRFAHLQQVEPELRQLPGNVLLSSGNTLEEDFGRSSWLLYRNSSVSFFAILAGLRPVYLQLPGELSNDVLFALNSWRMHVSGVDELGDVFAHDRTVTAEQRDTERKPAYAFAQRYMTPYRPERFEQVMEKWQDR